tara:strand:+ start:1868 stop:1999 length:132 start_codon:yes stop_codon:yes gene_type:complete
MIDKEKTKKSYFQKLIDFIAKILFIKRKKIKKKDNSDDIYTIW